MNTYKPRRPVKSKNIRNDLVDAEFERDAARRLARCMFAILNQDDMFDASEYDDMLLNKNLPKWLTDA